MDTALAPKVSLRGQVGRFVLHYFEMCIPMCIGFAVGDLIYFSIAEPSATLNRSRSCLCCRCSSSPSR